MYENYEIQRQIGKSRLFKRIKLTHSAKLVLLSLIDFYNIKNKYANVNQSTIADETGIPRQGVNTAIAELRRAGLIISANKLGFSCVYKLTDKFFESIRVINEENDLVESGRS